MNVRKSDIYAATVVVTGLIPYQVQDGVLVMSADDARKLAHALLAQVEAR